MAKLNESGNAPVATSAAQRMHPAGPPTIETLEAVKRNLIRQNRNLARANSTQSLQIRTLGAEVSRLLTSNIALKEENISLRAQLYEARGGYRVAGLRLIKKMMSDSLKEMTALLDGQFADDDNDDEAILSPETRKSMCLESMEFRERPSLKELMAEHRMPTIREHKTYPRPAAPPADTIPEEGPSDISSRESPDIGPPPVARSDSIQKEEDDTEGVSNHVSTEDDKPSENVQLPACDTTNIETRRRRKLSSSGVSARRQSDLMSRLSDKDSTMLKSGAKRKLSDMHSDSSDIRQVKSMSRGPAASPIRIVRETEASKENDDATDFARETIPILERPARKVLGEKSTNFSPKKLKNHNAKDTGKPHILPEKKSAPMFAGKKSSHGRQQRDKMDEIRLHANVTTDAEATTNEVVVPPITPLPADLFSPVSSERSFVGVGKVDTPPPLDLGMMSSAGAHEGARPSRRARAPVNYTEPSLVAKMRRPSKAMVDALSGLQDPRRAMNALSDRRTSSIADSETLLGETGVDIETAREDKAADNDDKSAPINDEEAAQQPQSRAQSHRQSRSLEDAQTEAIRSSSIKLSSLMASGRSRYTSTAGGEEVLDLAVFDFDDSSSTNSPAPEPVVERKSADKQGRRHSSAIKANSFKALDSSGRGEVNAASTASRTSSTTGRRRSMMI